MRPCEFSITGEQTTEKVEDWLIMRGWSRDHKWGGYCKKGRVGHSMAAAVVAQIEQELRSEGRLR